MLSALAAARASNEAATILRGVRPLIDLLQQTCQVHFQASGHAALMQTNDAHLDEASLQLSQCQQSAPLQQSFSQHEVLRSHSRHRQHSFCMMHVRFGHTIKHTGHGMHNRAAWAKASDDRDKQIATLQSMAQLEDFWSEYGGASPEVWKRLARKLKGRLPNLKPMERPPELKPCKLSYINLARFIRQLSYVLPRGMMLTTPGDNSNVVALPVSSSIAVGGRETFESRDLLLPRAKRLLDEACGHLVRRGKLCDPETAGQVLYSLGKLGYIPPPELTTLLLDRAAARMQEAYLKDLATTAEGLRLLGYTGGVADKWWSAAWQQAGSVLPTGMYDVNHVRKLVRSAAALGHAPPQSIQPLLTTAVPAQGQQQQAKAIA